MAGRRHGFPRGKPVVDHWDRYARHWELLGPPLRPPPDAVSAYTRELRPEGRSVLLLGVTPELSAFGASIVAVDETAAIIAALWPGDRPGRRAVVGDWLDLPIADASVEVVVGDGCLNAVSLRSQRRRLLEQIARVLKPGGRAAIRLFAGPETPEDLSAVTADAAQGRIANFHALKWRVAMACAAQHPERQIFVADILRSFNDLFPDRTELVRRTGWPAEVINTIDSYAGSSAEYNFVPAEALAEEAAQVFGQVRLAPTGTYALSERCPLLVFSSPLGA